MADAEEKRMTFTEHLGELRDRIIRSAIAVVVCVIACYALSDFIFQALKWPLSTSTPAIVTEAENIPENTSENAPEEASEEPPKDAPRALTWTTLNPLEYPILKIKLAAYAGFVLAFPFLLWQLCAFVFPGLRPKERRAVQVLIYGCGLLATAGVAVAYFGVFPLVLPYLLNWVPADVTIQLRTNETISILLKGIVGFAIAFQFPMAVLILVYMDLLSPATLKEYRKVAIVGMAVAAAMLTPPDPVSMLIMLLPLALLYEGSIWLSYLVVWRRDKAADKDTFG